MQRTVRFLTRRLAALLRGEGGHVAMMFALGAIPAVVAGGMGVDIARTYAVKLRLGAALDAAALAVGSSDPTKLNATQLQQRMQNYFFANYPSTALGSPPTPTMSYQVGNNNIINFTAQATVPTAFVRLIGIDSLTVTVSNQVTRGISGLELALVLDNTGSMLCGDGLLNNCAQGVPPSHITSLIADANAVVDTLFQNSVDTSKLKIAIVPYVTTVNIGPAFDQKGLLTSNYMTINTGIYKDIHGNTINDFSGRPITYDATQTENTAEWRGCVIEPVANNEDTTGNGPDMNEPAGGWTGPWTPFYWEPKTPPMPPKQTQYNDWNLTTKPILYYHRDGKAVTDWNASRGPNNGCPTPLVRLTNDQTALHAAINGLKAWDAGGTQIHVGMIWGWRVLSPNLPFADGQPYDSQNWMKVVVLMTDGQNELPDTNHLTGLSFLADGRFGSTDPNTALSNLDKRLQTVCTNMKEAGITVFTIGLGTGATSTLQNCAGGPHGGTYYAAATAADLQAAFQAIAASLNNLRLSR